jgi:hypothetical protein
VLLRLVGKSSKAIEPQCLQGAKTGIGSALVTISRQALHIQARLRIRSTRPTISSGGPSVWRTLLSSISRNIAIRGASTTTPSGFPIVPKQRTIGDMDQQPPTLEQLRRSACWWWLHCQNQPCLHKAPLALTPCIIRWGAEASSDLLRRSAQCSRCGRKGAILQHPGWAGSQVGWAPFPTHRQ